MKFTDYLFKTYKTRTDDLWAQQEAELNRLTADNQRLADAERSWSGLANYTYRTLLRAEGEALEALDKEKGEQDEKERLRWEGEHRLARKMQVAMEIGGRTFGIHLERPQ